MAIVGAFGAFYLPMVIMVNSYILTVRLLWRKAKSCREYEWTSDYGGGRIKVVDSINYNNKDNYPSKLHKYWRFVKDFQLFLNYKKANAALFELLTSENVIYS